jgi:pilus assembly protein Flp/PilA
MVAQKKSRSSINYSGMVMDRRAMIRFQQGVTSIEYALLSALIAIVIIGSVSATGSALLAMWESNAKEIGAAIASALAS